MDLAIVIAVVVVALVFDYTNGFHDAANAIATSVSTRALTPRVALALAAVMNFVGAFLGQEVAKTVSERDHAARPATHGLVDRPGRPARRDRLEPDHLVLRPALVVLARADRRPRRRGDRGRRDRALGDDRRQGPHPDGAVADRSASPRPSLVMLAIMWIFRRRNPHKVNRGFRIAQTVSAAAMALGHGLQDAQKTMGVIFLALLDRRLRRPPATRLPLWVIVSPPPRSRSAPTPVAGASCAPSAAGSSTSTRPAASPPSRSAAGVLYTTAFVFHAPISTTHTITSAIMGAGATKRFSAVRWGVARSIVVAWVLTFPMAGLVAAACLLRAARRHPGRV